MSDQAAIAQGEEKLLSKLAKAKVAQFVVQLSLETPVEHTLAGILTERLPVRVGRLRYVLGSDLLTELLMRGAESLEEEFPGALGLQEHLASLKKKECVETKSLPEKENPSRSKAWKKGEDAGKRQKEEAPAKVVSALAVSKLDLSSFDFGSDPIHPEKN